LSAEDGFLHMGYSYARHRKGLPMRRIWGFILFLYVLGCAVATTYFVSVSYELQPNGAIAYAVFAAIFVVGFVSFLRSTFR
jgi:hypothetical protein